MLVVVQKESIAKTALTYPHRRSGKYNIYSHETETTKRSTAARQNKMKVFPRIPIGKYSTADSKGRCPLQQVLLIDNCIGELSRSEAETGIAGVVNGVKPL
jgi:hypothetical protein